MKRRDFNKLILGAVGGLVAGSTLGGCESDDHEHHGGNGGDSCKGADGCNSCKGKDSCSGKDSCKAEKSCSGKDSCKAKSECSGK